MQAPTGQMDLPSSAGDHGLLVQAVPLELLAQIQLAQVCAFILNADAVSFTQLIVRITQKMSVVSLISECKLSSILVSFITLGWGFFLSFPSSHQATLFFRTVLPRLVYEFAADMPRRVNRVT